MDSIYKLTKKQKKYLPVKRAIDVVLASGASVALAPVMGIIALAIKLDSPGPILFKQKRIGKDKEFFEIWKFRTMRTDTPKDMPTHMLPNPDAYITKIGKFLRKTSLDELPQLWQCVNGSLSLVGPRPALWNQYDLVAERDKYGANGVKPGITGWAQINGRDELEIPVKAKFDGEYVEKMGFVMDLKCLLGTIGGVLSSDGVLEGGTREMHKNEKDTSAVALTEKNKKNTANLKESKRILITGANSYIGMSVDAWLNKIPEDYTVDTIDMMGDAWKECDFSQYDVVYHVAGIAHADIGSVTEEQKQLYYKVNTDLAIEVAKKAKEQGVKQFIFMSSIIVYSGCKEKMITCETQPTPLNFYGDSKWQADQKVREFTDDFFKVVVLRPPMIYGKGCKGNYLTLAKLAGMLPVFPIVKNKRSMLHIDNLCEFVKLMIDNEETGVFFPQNAEYTNTSNMIRLIAEVKGHRIIMIPFTNLFVKLMESVPGKVGKLATKAFGDSAYEMEISGYKENYRVLNLLESIRKTEE